MLTAASAVSHSLSAQEGLASSFGLAVTSSLASETASAMIIVDSVLAFVPEPEPVPVPALELGPGLEPGLAVALVAGPVAALAVVADASSPVTDPKLGAVDCFVC